MLKIAFSGKSGAGKDFACEYLINRHGGYNLKFANALHAQVRALSSASRFAYDRDRELEQALGAWTRKRDPNYYVRELVSVASDLFVENVYVSDVRFKNEAETLRALGFVLVRLSAGIPDHTEQWRKDVSETELDTYPHYDYAITNCKKDRHLQECLDTMVTIIKEGRHTWHPRSTITVR